MPPATQRKMTNRVKRHTTSTPYSAAMAACGASRAIDANRSGDEVILKKDAIVALFLLLASRRIQLFILVGRLRDRVIIK